MDEQSCEDCRFWKQGDLSAKGIGNVGQCTVLMVQTSGFYDRNPGSPFWAEMLSFRTASYDGRGCNTFKENRP